MRWERKLDSSINSGRVGPMIMFYSISQIILTKGNGINCEVSITDYWRVKNVIVLILLSLYRYKIHMVKVATYHFKDILNPR